MLGLSTNNALDPCLLHPPTNPAGVTRARATRRTRRPTTAARCSFTAPSTDAQVWTITVDRDVSESDGPGSAPITRRLTASVPITANQNDPANTAIWNYIVSTKTSNATTCDVSLGNSVTSRSRSTSPATSVSTTRRSDHPADADRSRQGDRARQARATCRPEHRRHVVAARSTRRTSAAAARATIVNSTHACTSSDKVYADTLVNTRAPRSRFP